MIEPTRLLLDANAPEEAAALLRSLSAPAPLSAVKQAQFAQHLAALSSTPTAVATVGVALWLKAGAAVGVLGLVTAWAVVKLQAPETPRARAGASASPVASLLPSVAGAAPELAHVEPQHSEALHERPTPSTHAKAAARDNLAAEEPLLEQARRLAGPSPARALALLQQYQRRFPTGQLAAERMFLSVDVLTRLGNTAGARKQADALMRAFPSSVYAAQVKARSSAPD